MIEADSALSAGLTTGASLVPTTVTATFALQRLTLTVAKAGNGSGTVTSNPTGINCGATCAADFNFNQSKGPGVYSFTFTTQGGQKETQSYAFNVDAPSESDLRRADKEKLERNKAEGAGGKRGTIKVLAPGDDLTGFKARVPNFSESPWLFLFILLILVGEQAMAVHLSHHMRGEGMQAVPAPAAGPGRAAA